MGARISQARKAGVPFFIHVHSNGRFLYGSNRGHDSIVVYAIDQDTGQFALVEIVPTGGANPRNFGLDPTATCLSVGNHSTDDIFTFRVDPDTDQFTQKCMGLFNFAFAGRLYF